MFGDYTYGSDQFSESDTPKEAVPHNIEAQL
jgi:hypothetical protein